MPSDAKKKRDQKKKEQVKSRGTAVKKPTQNGSGEPVELSAEGTRVVFFLRQKILTVLCVTFRAEALYAQLEADAQLNAEARSCTGSLAVHPKSRDVKISNFSITFHGCEMLQDTLLELNCGRRYGLLGANGCGQYFLRTLNISKECMYKQIYLNFVEIFWTMEFLEGESPSRRGSDLRSR